MRLGAALVLISSLTAGIGAAWVPTVQGQEATSDTTTAQAVPSYRPPLRGAPASRIGGAHRGAEGDDWALLVLAPEHTGLTTAAQPTLYWYTSKDVADTIEITLIERGAIDPIMERTVAGPASAGVQRVVLADWGVSLRPEIEYQWFVSVITDPTQRSKDYTAGATIRRVTADPQVNARLQKAGIGERAFIYAEAGLWYDAIDVLSRQIDAAPRDATARRQRLALIEQVGLQLRAE